MDPLWTTLIDPFKGTLIHITGGPLQTDSASEELLREDAEQSLGLIGGIEG